MALPVSNVVEQMSQLDAARNLVLGDAAFYPQIVHGILPIIGANARLELRRWGADFLAETFASPAFPYQPKQKLSVEILKTLQELLDIPGDDSGATKSAIQVTASIYPLIFRHIVDHPEDSSTWETMTSIKHTILKKWGSSPQGTQICCIKFVETVVQIQTQGVISDPRRPEKNETSLAIVPRNHPLLVSPNIEAETSGLLDRLLNVFYENSCDPLLVNATLNCLPALIRSRASAANKILEAVINFNPLKQAQGPVTPTVRVNVKSMERTVRALLVNVLKRNPNHALAGRIQQHIERLSQSRTEVLEEGPKKRALPTEPTDVVDRAKRARLGVDTPPQLRIPPLPEGPVSFAQLFTLTEDVGLTTFDVKQLPLDLVVKITVPVLGRVDPESLDHALGAVRSRYLTLSKKAAFEQKGAAPPGPAGAGEDDDYEPEYEPMDITGPAAANQAETVAAPESLPADLALGPFILPQPPSLSAEEASLIGKGTVERIFGMITTLEQPSMKTAKSSSQAAGFGRLAASSLDKDSWLTLLTRVVTRASAGLDPDETAEEIKREDAARGDQLTPSSPHNLADGIREMLYRYVLEDFRVRMNAAISWLNEEWYNDKMQLKRSAAESGKSTEEAPTLKHYDRWALKILEGILPYLDAKDKVLIRFLSEIPELGVGLIGKVKTLANDPERVNLCVQALHYLVLVRPPARELCLDALEDIYQKVEEARPLITKILSKWRPGAIPQPQPQAEQAIKQEPQGQAIANAANGVGTSAPGTAKVEPSGENASKEDAASAASEQQPLQQEGMDGTNSASQPSLKV